MSPWQTLYDKIIVHRHPPVTHIAGMEVPEAAREKQNIGTVVQVGEGRLVPGHAEPIPLRIQPGHEVLFNKYAGVPLEGADPDLVILREDEILAFRLT